MRTLNSIIIISIITSFAFVSCNTNRKSKVNKISQKSENFDWLLGKWKRNNEEQGKETFENWGKISNSEYSGIGFTMQKGDTIKQEKINLIKQNGKWDLIVKIPEETESLIFKMTDLDKDSFTCENDSLDFPKMIKYWKDGLKIKALVAGKDLEIPFEFEKVN